MSDSSSYKMNGFYIFIVEWMVASLTCLFLSSLSSAYTFYTSWLTPFQIFRETRISMAESKNEKKKREKKSSKYFYWTWCLAEEVVAWCAVCNIIIQTQFLSPFRSFTRAVSVFLSTNHNFDIKCIRADKSTAVSIEHMDHKYIADLHTVNRQSVDFIVFFILSYNSKYNICLIPFVLFIAYGGKKGGRNDWHERLYLIFIAP